MTMRWRVSAKCSGEDEVVLTETRSMAEFISDCFVDKGCTGITITQLPQRPPEP